MPRPNAVPTDARALIDTLDARFKSGNSVPVRDIRLTLEEWDVLRRALTNNTLVRDTEGRVIGVSG